METAISTLSVLPETRDQQHNFANKAVEELMNGDYDLPTMWAKMSIYADTLEEIMKSTTLRAAVLSELEKYGKEGVMVSGCKLSVASRKNYDYSTSGSSEYTQLKARIKEVEVLLKALKEPMANPETGEMIYPPAYTITEYVTVK